MKEREEVLAICLKREFLEDGKIKALLLTKREGLLSVYVSLKKNLERLELFAPGVLVLLSLSLKKGDRAVFHEGKVVDPFFKVKQDFDRIEVCQKILYYLDFTQWHKKEGSPLFELLLFSLRALEKEDPKTIEALFLIKLLIYEGIFCALSQCVECDRVLEGTYRLGGEVFCQEHAPQGAYLCSLEEEKVITHLALAKKREEIQIKIGQALLEKIRALFISSGITV